MVAMAVTIPADRNRSRMNVVMVPSRVDLCGTASSYHQASRQETASRNICTCLWGLPAQVRDRDNLANYWQDWKSASREKGEAS